MEKLKKNVDIIIKMSDKCKSLVILDKSTYVNKAKHILEDEYVTTPGSIETRRRRLKPQLSASSNRQYGASCPIAA